MPPPRSSALYRPGGRSSLLVAFYVMAQNGAPGHRLSRAVLQHHQSDLVGETNPERDEATCRRSRCLAVSIEFEDPLLQECRLDIIVAQRNRFEVRDASFANAPEFA